MKTLTSDQRQALELAVKNLGLFEDCEAGDTLVRHRSVKLLIRMGILNEHQNVTDYGLLFYSQQQENDREQALLDREYEGERVTGATLNSSLPKPIIALVYKTANETGMSISEVVHRALVAYFKGRGEDIEFITPKPGRHRKSRRVDLNTGV